MTIAKDRLLGHIGSLEITDLHRVESALIRTLALA